MSISIHRSVVSAFDENCWYLVNTRNNQGFFIDPGENFPELVQQVEGTQTEPVAIINTHAHLDHIGAVSQLQHRYDIPFYLDSRDEYLLELYPEHSAMFGVQAHATPHNSEILDAVSHLDLAGINIEVLHTPGHTPGGVSFLVGNHLFTGDTLFKDSVGRVDLTGGDYESLRHSILSILLALDDDTIVHPGHGEETTIGAERRHNPFIRDWLSQG